jgi:hypothetical protein
MTSSAAGDPLAALILQIADNAEQLSNLDAREAAHHRDLTAQLAELSSEAAAASAQVSALASSPAQSAEFADTLDRLDQRIVALTRKIQDLAADGYQPGPQPRWWHLTGPERDAALSQLRAWVDQIYRPGYGHLAAALPACWDRHPQCVYAIDWLSELWNALYLTASRTTAVLAAQAEWQTRLLPAAAAQMSREVATCRHAGPLRYPTSPTRPA